MDNKQIKKTLNLIIEPDLVINSISLKKIKSLTNNEIQTVKDILDKDEEYKKYFTTGLINKFEQVREKSLSMSQKSESYKVNASLQIHLFSLINSLINYMKNVTDDVNKLIESNDNWLNSVGYKIIKHHVTPENIELLESTFREMRKKGVNEYPYKVGEYLASCLLENQDVYKVLLLNFEDENDNFKQAVLQTFSMIEELPLKVEEFILSTINKSQGDVRSLAVLASGNCKKLRKKAIKQLVNELSSQYWYVRGNAATSLAKLQVSNVEIISKIMTLFGDREGCDWTAEESAINALTTIGKSANICIPELLKQLRTEMAGECDEIYITDICEALRKIDDGTEIVITALIEVVKKCDDEALISAIRALGTFGEKSKGVLNILKKRINSKTSIEPDFVDDDRAEIILVKNIYKIGGAESNLFKSYLRKLKSHTDKEIQQAVINFERSINLQ